MIAIVLEGATRLLQSTLNACLGRNAFNQDILIALENTQFQAQLSDIHQTLGFAFHGGQIRISYAPLTSADFVLMGTSRNLGKIFGPQAANHWQVLGDPQQAEVFFAQCQHLDSDCLSALEPLLGRWATHGIETLTHEGQKYWQDIRQDWQTSLEDYLKYEIQLLIDQHQWQELEDRVKQLENKVGL